MYFCGFVCDGLLSHYEIVKYDHFNNRRTYVVGQIGYLVNSQISYSMPMTSMVSLFSVVW